MLKVLQKDLVAILNLFKKLKFLKKISKWLKILKPLFNSYKGLVNLKISLYKYMKFSRKLKFSCEHMLILMCLQHLQYIQKNRK